MEDVKQLISLSAIFDYVGSQKRCLIEGEEIFKRKHIICCGIRQRTLKTIIVFALCLSTSSLHGKPHELSICFSREEDGALDFTVYCSCIAGQSRKCKHCIGVLLYLNSVTVDELEDLTCTDLEQQWGKLKGESRKMYQPCKIEDLCHVKAIRVNSSLNVSDSLKDQIRNCLIGAAPNSALALHLKGRNTAQLQVLLSKDQNNIPFLGDKHNLDSTTSLFSNICNFDKEMSFFECVPLNHGLKMVIKRKCFEQQPEQDKHFFLQYVNVTQEEAIEICKQTRTQSLNSTWKHERSKRITGSVCYSFYTFNGDDKAWEEKILKQLNSSFKGNSSTNFGLQNEQLALARYADVTDRVVHRLGFVINPSKPFLGFSPDGVVFMEGKPYRFVEVKCPVAGSHTNIYVLARSKKLRSLKVNGENIEVNHQHHFYGQIQLAMGLTCVPSTDLVFFSKCDNDILTVNVERDDQFISQLFEKLTWVYFKYLLPVLSKLAAHKAQK